MNSLMLSRSESAICGLVKQPPGIKSEIGFAVATDQQAGRRKVISIVDEWEFVRRDLDFSRPLIFNGAVFVDAVHPHRFDSEIVGDTRAAWSAYLGPEWPPHMT